MIKGFRRFASRYLIADAAPLSPAERRRSTLAAFLGMLLIQAVLVVLPGDPAQRQLLAPLGASCVLLFALPHSPLGQPWSTAGGLLLPALIGWLCGIWLAPTWLAVAAALALAIWLMAGLRCLHPPGGAMAVLFASLPATATTDLYTALFNTVAVLFAALAINTLLPGRLWPQCASAPPPAVDPARPVGEIGHADLQYALAEIDSYLDISEEDLVRVYELATGHAFRRHERRTVGEIMRRDVPSVEFATELNEAWRLLREQRSALLPVVNRARHVIGLVGADDFLRHVVPDGSQRLADNVRRLLRPSPTPYAEQPEVVGQIMRHEVPVLRDGDGIGHAAALLLRHPAWAALPVVGPDKKLVGLLRQGDLLAALYHGQKSGAAHLDGTTARYRDPTCA